VTRLLSLVGVSLPVVVSGILMLLAFALHWRIFPVIGAAWHNDPLDRLTKIILPAITLGITIAAYITRVTRSAMLHVMNEDFIRTARAKGVFWPGFVWRHGLGDATDPKLRGE